MQVTKVLLGAAAVATLAAGSAFGQTTPPWSDDFESYACDSALGGQGGWSYWDNNPAWDSWVRCVQARSGSNSVDIVGDSDTIMQFEGANCGQWRMTAYQYVPSSFSGESYFIVQNTYNHGGPYNWSVQLRADSALGVVEAEFWGFQLPLITDEWVEIVVDIDLENDLQTMTYGGQIVYEDISWTDGLNNGNVGELNIGAIDLFANGASSVYYDDLSVEQTGDCTRVLALEVGPLIGGEPGTFTVTGAESNNQVAVLYALRTRDPIEGQQGNFCAKVGIAINLQNPTENLVCQGLSDGSGNFECTTAVPRQASGRTVFFQAFEANTCPIYSESNIVEKTIL